MRKRNAFTLTELLVVIGCVAVLFSLLLPVASKARAASRAANCLSTLRQLGNAWTMYMADNRGAMIPYVWNTPQTPNLAYGSYWFGVLEANGIRDEALMCPSADLVELSPTRRGYGTANTAWTGRFSTIGTAIRFSPGKYRDGSYGYNRYLTAKNGFGPDGRATNILAITGSLGEVPVFMDCTYADIQPNNGTPAVPIAMPPDLTGGAGTLGSPDHYKLLIARHGRAINVGMADGSARLVPLTDLYELQWKSQWQKYQLTLP